MWRSLARPATVGLTGLFGAVDPYYHGLHVGGHTRSRVVSGVHFPLQLPDEVKLRPRFRVALAVRTASRRNYGTTVAYFDLTEAIERGEAEHRRLIEMFPDRDDD